MSILNVKLIKNIIINGKPGKIDEVHPVEDQDAKFLVAQGSARIYLDSEKQAEESVKKPSKK
ncbi:MAG: hypothetical protein KC646_10235 [Candidatus Cloacimonetes bacterium]|nr:hypothetical protein [Candidatus Cloacimonadota bacterium]